MLHETKKKVTEAFDIFDHEANGTVDEREVGTIIRSLGCCPSEAELQEIIAELVENEVEEGFVHFENFLPVMTNILVENKFQPASDEELLKAFEALDQQNKGFLMKDDIKELLTKYGEPFNEEELEEMMSHALDAETDHVPYRKYVYTLNPIDEA